ncbi:hypothetical protein [Alicyclobacillus fastidiosus]|nr:hypothetical protein [Alicyclobacillus fastidiosus]GMA59953.1 hypothetical protein GCM10025859_03930 [Alicyclobacillus fastidiosus]
MAYCGGDNAEFSKGDPVTAQSFVVESERVLGKGGVVSSGSAYLESVVVGATDYATHKRWSIRGVSTPDKYTLVIHLTKPEPFF